MKLWLLEPVLGQGEEKKGTAWDPWFDKAFGFVIRAESEMSARVLADANAGDENNEYSISGNMPKGNRHWLDPKQSTCIELTAKGQEEIVLKDFASA